MCRYWFLPTKSLTSQRRGLRCFTASSIMLWHTVTIPDKKAFQTRFIKCRTIAVFITCFFSNVSTLFAHLIQRTNLFSICFMLEQETCSFCLRYNVAADCTLSWVICLFPRLQLPFPSPTPASGPALFRCQAHRKRPMSSLKEGCSQSTMHHGGCKLEAFKCTI
jgi:hypothetical protein